MKVLGLGFQPKPLGFGGVSRIRLQGLGVFGAFWC